MVLFLFSIPVFMLVYSGIQSICRYAVFNVFFTLWMPLLLIIPLKDSHFLYLLPLLKEGWLPIFKTIKSTILAFLGFEFSFVLYPHLKDKRFATKAIIIANLITILVYLQITLVCFVYFSPDDITRFLWPTLSLITPFHFSFLERFEIFFGILYSYYF